MHIGIIGSGYVGLVTGACFAEFGVFVTCVDKDERKLKTLRKGKVPFYEPGLEELVQRNVKNGRLKFTSKVGDAIAEALVIFIAVGTPPRGDGSADLSYIEEVAEEIAKYMDGYKVVVTKSTVPVGTGKKIRDIISKNRGGQVQFDIVSNPEFLREGAAIEDFMRPNRVVIGSESQQAIAIMKDLYKPLYLIETPIVVTNVETAELIKYASNSFLAAKISFINEISNLCEKVGADVNIVAKAMGLDHRIGPKFLHAGLGFGGSCFPKDTKALLKIAKDHHVELGIVNSAISANDNQRKLAVAKIKRVVGDLKGKTVAVLGLSFKPNTDDLREAPALFIIELLLKEGAKVRVYDPVAMENAKPLFSKAFFAEGPYDAAKGADALAIVTEWNEFRNLELEALKRHMKQPLFFDFRNVYDPGKMKKMGFEYYSIGRP